MGYSIRYRGEWMDVEQFCRRFAGSGDINTLKLYLDPKILQRVMEQRKDNWTLRDEIECYLEISGCELIIDR